MGTNENRPLLESLVNSTRLPWYGATAIVGGSLLILLALCFFLEAISINDVTWANLRGPLLPVAIIEYVLAIYPLLKKFKEAAVASLMQTAEMDGDSGTMVSHAFSSPRTRWELTSVVVGLVVFAIISQPWLWVRSPLSAYAAVADAIMFGILGFLVFDGLDGTLRVSRMTHQHLKLDVFEADRLVPVANWSLAISMAFIGGITISIAFQSLDNLRHWQTFTFYAALLSVALSIFFLSMWSTHAAIVRVKREELFAAEDNLNLAFRELRRSGGWGQVPENGSVYSKVNAWASYERRLREVREWPYRADALRRLTVSVLAPSLVYLLKLLLGWRL